MNPLSPMPPGRMLSSLLACLGGLLVCIATAQEPPAAPGWLRLTGGDHLAGTLQDSPRLDSKTLRWRHASFATPFQFALDQIRSAAFPPAELPKRPGGTFLVELANGDRLFGELASIDQPMIRVKTGGFGEVQLKRGDVRQISRWNQDDGIPVVGPRGLQKWTDQQERGDWIDQGGQLSTKQENASLFRDGALTERARIEFTLSWDGDPNFVLAFGVDGDDLQSSTKTAFRLEVWEDEVVLLRETDDAADVVSVAKVAELDGNLTLRLDLDQITGTAVATTAIGKPPLVIHLVSQSNSQAHTGIRLLNLSGSVRLDSIEVFSLGPPREVADGATGDSFTLRDDSVLVGQWTGIDADTWIVTHQGKESRIDPDDVVSVQLANSDTDSARQGVDHEDQPTQSLFRVLTHSGDRLTGVLRGVRNGQLIMDIKSAIQPASVPTAQVSRILAVDFHPQPTEPSLAQSGRLEWADGQLTGRLIEAPEGTMPTPLRFQSRNAPAVTLSPRFAGRLVYRDPPPPETPAERQQRMIREAKERQLKARAAARAPQQKLNMINLLTRAFGAPTGQPTREPKSIHLCSGEIIPCEIESIDERGVVFKAKMTTQTRLPHDQIRAVRLASDTTEPVLETVEQERLLTVPRVAKKYPPTHLIVAKNGDLLRCRLLRLTDQIAQVETRLETLDIDRALLSQIIWLENTTLNASEDETPADKDLLNVRARMRSGNHLSLIPHQVTDRAIKGAHPYLGDLSIQLNNVDELIFGDFIGQTDARRPYRQWQLRDAPEPMIADEDGGRTPGTASALVGTDAPDFTLDLLDGGSFQVDGQKGKILVLDFWATWCGPCLQAMPVIDQVISSFDEADVMLVAVNLQETAEPIRNTLQRLNLSPNVAMDLDGVAAARYQADAIPQTVVIDRQGKITRVFVGSGGDLAEQLRTAIEEQLDAG